MNKDLKKKIIRIERLLESPLMTDGMRSILEDYQEKLLNKLNLRK